MKKVFLFVAIIILVVGMSLRMPVLQDDEKQVKLYIGGAVPKGDNIEVIQNGTDSIVMCSSEVANNLIQKYNVLCITFFEQNNVMQVVAKYNMRILHTEQVGDITNYFGYTHKYSFKDILLDGQYINMQIAKRQNDIIVGFPIIFTDY